MADLLLRGRRLLLADGERAADVEVRAGRVAAVHAHDEGPEDAPILDAGELAVLPGLVDTHAHVNEPGRTEWEGFETATRAAAAGGITTLVDMPLNSLPPTTTVAALDAKAEAARGRCAVDYGFWGGVVPGNAAELEPMVEAGTLGFKAFLIDSGVPEFPPAREADLRAAMPILARLGVPLLVHAELESPAPKPSGRRYDAYLASRPRAWEDEAIRWMIRLCRETGCRVHVVHLSSSGALEDLRRARAEGLPITAETCPHYLTFCSEEVPEGATPFKCAPPIRERENREKLWAALADGTISMVVSDHSPCTPALKGLEAGDFAKAWGGIASLQFSLSATWTGMRERGLPLARLADWMSAAPARLAGLSAKGGLTPGMDADFVLFDPEASFTVEADAVLHRHKVTPYAGRTLFGRVQAAYLRGRPAAGPAGLRLGRAAAASPL